MCGFLAADGVAMVRAARRIHLIAQIEQIVLSRFHAFDATQHIKSIMYEFLLAPAAQFRKSNDRPRRWRVT